MPHYDKFGGGDTENDDAVAAKRRSVSVPGTPRITRSQRNSRRKGLKIAIPSLGTWDFGNGNCGTGFV